MRVLIVDDEEVLAHAIAEGLREESIAADVVLDGEAALDRASYVDYDVIVLDRDLPVVHGDVVCEKLAAARNASRILMLTAAGDWTDRVDGLSMGADDYLPKPFIFAELVARIRALGRRTPPVLEQVGIRRSPDFRAESPDVFRDVF